LTENALERIITGGGGRLVSVKAMDLSQEMIIIYEGWNFNSGNYLFTTDT